MACGCKKKKGGCVGPNCKNKGTLNNRGVLVNDDSSKNEKDKS